MSSGRINLQTASREEMADLIRRQAAKLKEMQNSAALLQERDDRLASLAQANSLVKQELAEARASHAADRAAMQEQLETLSQQIVSSEETIAQLLDAQEHSSRGKHGGGGSRSVSEGATSARSNGYQNDGFGSADDVLSAMDGVMRLRAERLEEELTTTRAALKEAHAKLAAAADEPDTPLTTKWARNDEITNLRSELAAAHNDVAESQGALARCEAERAELQQRAHHLAHELASLELKSLTAHIAPQASGGSAGDRSATPRSQVSAAPVFTGFSPEGVVPPVVQGPPMPRPSAAGGRHRAGSTQSLSNTSGGRGPALDPSFSATVRVPPSGSVGRFGSSLSSSTTHDSSDGSDDSSSGDGIPWGASTAAATHGAVAHFGADGPRQEATVVGATSAGGALFAGGATMSKLRRRIAELEAEVARRDKAAAGRLREERALSAELRAQVAALEAELASVREALEAARKRPELVCANVETEPEVTGQVVATAPDGSSRPVTRQMLTGQLATLEQLLANCETQTHSLDTREESAIDEDL